MAALPFSPVVEGDTWATCLRTPHVRQRQDSPPAPAHAQATPHACVTHVARPQRPGGNRATRTLLAQVIFTAMTASELGFKVLIDSLVGRAGDTLSAALFEVLGES